MKSTFLSPLTTQPQLKVTDSEINGAKFPDSVCVASNNTYLIQKKLEYMLSFEYKSENTKQNEKRNGVFSE